MDLQELAQRAAGCHQCELDRGRMNPVFARGNPNSKVMVCGMCPGPEENKQGVPFVGTAGKILDEILVRIFGSPDEVYITNLVKCFVPPGTSLQSNWMDACLPYFVLQVRQIKPELIITLGGDVANYLLRPDKPMRVGEMRGNLYQFLGTNLVVTYHPSYLARGGGVKHRHFGAVLEDINTALGRVK